VVTVGVSALILLPIALYGQGLWAHSLSPSSSLPLTGAVIAILGQVVYLAGSNGFRSGPKHPMLRRFDGWFPVRGRWLWAALATAGLLVGLGGLCAMWAWFFGPHF
jgi:hypothetical protein